MKSKRAVYCLLIVAAAVAIALARPREAPVIVTEVANPLNTRIGVLQIKSAALEQAVATLREKSGVNIVVDWQGLQNVIRKDRLVEVELHDVTLLTALKVLMGHTSARDFAAHSPRIGYAALPGVVRVYDSTDAANEPTFVRVYDVRDLLSREYLGREPLPAGINDPEPDMLWLIILVSNQVGLFGNLYARPAPSFSGYAGRLVVVHTMTGHAEVEEILRELRRVK
jgi:hypothetical protein